MAKDGKVSKLLEDRILNDDDYIHCPRLKNSLTNMVNTNPEGVDNERIAKVLLITEEEVEELYQSALRKLRKVLGK